MRKIIEVKKLNLLYDNKEIFNNLSFDIYEKDFICIHGKSGSGKTSLLNILSLIEKNYNGDILLFGKNYKNFTKKDELNFYRNDVSFLFQNYGLIEHETVEYNLSIALKNNKNVRKKDYKIEMEKYLKKVDLDINLQRKVFTLSGGEQQRLSIVRLFLKPSTIIFADEPTGSLDKENSDIIMKYLHELNQQKTIILVTHSEEYINQIKKRINLNEKNINNIN